MLHSYCLRGMSYEINMKKAVQLKLARNARCS